MAQAIRAHGLVAVPLDAGGYRWLSQNIWYRWNADDKSLRTELPAGKLGQLMQCDTIEEAMLFSLETISAEDFFKEEK
jgi:hypothetical protein